MNSPVYKNYIKRGIEIAIIAGTSIVWIPLLIICSVVLYITIGLPILFRQHRPGENNNPFLLVKFRTMKNTKDENGNLLCDEKRITKIGKFLRSTSLDELPELYNVIRGEMSLVGPRPLLMQYISRYSSEQLRRHEVKPGITGWAQVNGRNAISWEEKFKLDVWYVDHISFTLDIKILWLTFWKVVKRSDISQKDHATVEEFMGSVSE